MIPIKLTLKNFMSYGDPPVSLPFDGLHVACLCGDNGNGKSAILDAITYALWSKTRASSVRAVSEDDLIRLGADEMEVRFEFELNAQRYRVIRKRRRGKSSGSDWQLAMQDAAGGWAPIGGTSQRETGRLIVQLLNMEYETFLNSAYLQQGRADEFTRQTPDSRKRILGEILGLDRYDRLEEKARDRNKERRERADDLEREIRVLEGQIGQLPEHRTRLAETHAALAAIRPRLAEQEATAHRLRDERAHLDAITGQAAQQDAALRRALGEAAQLETERASQAERLAGLRRTLEQRDAILADSTALQRAIERREALEPMVEAFNRVAADLRTVVGVIDAEEQKLRGEIRLTENQVANAERLVRERERLATQVREMDRELAAEPDQEAALQKAVSAQQALQQEFSDLSAANREVAAALDDIKDVIELLERPRAVCPVCESDLSGDKRALTLARQQAKRDQLVVHQRDVQQAGRVKKQALTAAQESTAALTAARDAQVARRNRLADLRSHLATLGDPARELAAHRNRLETLQGQVARGEFAAPQRAQRVRLQAEHERLGLAKSEYEAVRQQILRLEPARRRYQELLQAESGLERECANIERLERALAEGARTRSELEATLAALRKRLARYAEVAAAADRADADLKRLQGELNTLAIAEGSLVRYIAEAERAEADRRARESLKSQVDEERRMYAALAKAFGKSGVQALIIENAIPELADEANMLLARMTDNAMQLSFETVRAAKQGGHEIETLDIRIADDAGVRPYELFSGGEAFRINFAIRIALSRLLARRSGARLQTLIMDEGFGSQDGKGREKLVELIETIKDDFEKILVITHVEELKDAFANRVEITKDAAGSHIHLL